MYINPKDKIFWHLEEINQLKQTGKSNAPINVEIDLTNRCNLGCDWCHFAYTHTKGPLANSAKPDGFIDVGDVFDWELLNDVLVQLRQQGVKSITWTGGGEPTLYYEFNKAIKAAQLIGLDQGIYTNGTRLDQEKAKLLKEYCTFVYISLDECNAEDYEQSKGVNQFHKAIEGIKNLVDAVGTATIGVGFLLHERNYTKYPQMIDLAKSLGVDYCQFRPTINYDQNNPSAAIEHPTWINYLPTVNLKNVVFDKERFLQYQNWLGHGYTTCYWSALQTVITPNGKVWRCVNKRGYEDALLGDLTQESFASIWERSGVASVVDSKCRVMCRGHIANQTLDKLMKEPDHANFI